MNENNNKFSMSLFIIHIKTKRKIYKLSMTYNLQKKPRLCRNIKNLMI